MWWMSHHYGGRGTPSACLHAWQLVPIGPQGGPLAGKAGTRDTTLMPRTGLQVVTLKMYIVWKPHNTGIKLYCLADARQMLLLRTLWVCGFIPDASVPSAVMVMATATSIHGSFCICGQHSFSPSPRL